MPEVEEVVGGGRSCQMGEEGDLVGGLEGCRAGPHRVRKSVGGLAEHLVGDQQGRRVPRAGHVRAQRLARLGQPEGALLVLGEEPVHGEQTQDAPQKIGVQAGARGEILGRAGAVGQLVGDAVHGHGADRRRTDMAEEERFSREGVGSVEWSELVANGPLLSFGRCAFVTERPADAVTKKCAFVTASRVPSHRRSARRAPVCVCPGRGASSRLPVRE
ncbi:hypothetical protein ACFV98_20975 [Streptomyces violascens]|uniref:hypothetical protein n=1 Tax=Streptomyces violascens TaxID=67381 RepID=UPI003663EF45